MTYRAHSLLVKGFRAHLVSNIRLGTLSRRRIYNAAPRRRSRRMPPAESETPSLNRAAIQLAQPNGFRIGQIDGKSSSANLVATIQSSSYEDCGPPLRMTTHSNSPGRADVRPQPSIRPRVRAMPHSHASPSCSMPRSTHLLHSGAPSVTYRRTKFGKPRH